MKKSTVILALVIALVIGFAASTLANKAVDSKAESASKEAKTDGAAAQKSSGPEIPAEHQQKLKDLVAKSQQANQASQLAQERVKAAFYMICGEMRIDPEKFNIVERDGKYIFEAVKQ